MGNSSSQSGSNRHRPLPPNTDRDKVYVAQYLFAAANSDELSLKVNDQVLLLDDSDSVWWKVKQVHGRRTGFVPRNYITKLDPISSLEPSDSNYVSIDERVDTIRPPLPPRPIPSYNVSVDNNAMYATQIDSHEVYTSSRGSVVPVANVSSAYASLDGTHQMVEDKYMSFDIMYTNDSRWKEKNSVVEKSVKNYDKETAERRLKNTGLVPGSYVFRKSVSHPGSYVLVHCGTDKKIRNYPIELCQYPEVGFFTLLCPAPGVPHKFQGLQEVVAHYTAQTDGIQCCLSTRVI